MQLLRHKIGEKEKQVRRPEILKQAYVDRIYDEIETLQRVVAEIYDSERRREFIKQHLEIKGKEKENRMMKLSKKLET